MRPSSQPCILSITHPISQWTTGDALLTATFSLSLLQSNIQISGKRLLDLPSLLIPSNLSIAPRALNPLLHKLAVPRVLPMFAHSKPAGMKETLRKYQISPSYRKRTHVRVLPLSSKASVITASPAEPHSICLLQSLKHTHTLGWSFHRFG